MIFYLLDLLGVAVFAVSGALAAGRKDLDLLGVVVISSVTAIGGGTLRDVLLNRHPIFWIANPMYLGVIIATAIFTVFYAHLYPVPTNALQIADALGLALFAMSGALIAEAAKLSPLIVVLMGTMTGVAGGVVRDILSDEIPLILRQDIYASAAIAGISFYLLLKMLRVKHPWAFGLGMAVIVILRFMAIVWHLQLPVFRFS